MLAAFRSFHSSVFLRAISIACVVVAFSYIFFEVLDLDGSNFPLQRFPVENAAIVPEVETNIVRPYLTRWAVPWTEVLCSLLPEQVDSVRPRLIENFKASALNSIQRRNYRVALPRSSVPDHL
jgi:hypothetical protein